MAKEELPLDECRSLLGPDATTAHEQEIEAVRAAALAMAEVVTQAYADFRAEVPDFDPAAIRSASDQGMWKLLGIELTDEDLELLEAETQEEIDE